MKECASAVLDSSIAEAIALMSAWGSSRLNSRSSLRLEQPPTQGIGLHVLYLLITSTCACRAVCLSTRPKSQNTICFDRDRSRYIANCRRVRSLRRLSRLPVKALYDFVESNCVLYSLLDLQSFLDISAWVQSTATTRVWPMKPMAQVIRMCRMVSTAKKHHPNYQKQSPLLG